MSTGPAIPTVTGTGVELRLSEPHVLIEASSALDKVAARKLVVRLERAEVLVVEYQFFAEFRNGETAHGSVGRTEFPTTGDATNALLGLVDSARRDALGDVFGDLRREGLELTRFEFYACPFRIELADGLRQRLDIR